MLAARRQRSIRFRDRSYTAVVLSPEQPIAEWISEFDHWIGSSTLATLLGGWSCSICPA